MGDGVVDVDVGTGLDEGEDCVAPVAGVPTVAAVIVDPTTVLARAAGVLKSALVEAIGVDPAVTALAALGAGAPASVFADGAGLNESRILVAAT